MSLTRDAQPVRPRQDHPRGSEQNVRATVVPRAPSGSYASDDTTPQSPATTLPQLLDWDEETVQEHWDLVLEVVRTHESADVLADASVWCNRAEPDVQAVGLDLLGSSA